MDVSTDKSLGLLVEKSPFINVRAKLTPAARKLLEKNPSGIKIYGDYIQDTIENVTKYRLQLLSKLLESEQHSFDEQPAFPSTDYSAKIDKQTSQSTARHAEGTAESNEAHTARNRSTVPHVPPKDYTVEKPKVNPSQSFDQASANISGRITTSDTSAKYYIDEFLYLYDKVVYNSRFHSLVQDQYKCTMEVMASQAPSIFNPYVELCCKPPNREAQVLYTKSLEDIRQRISTIVISLPSCLTQLINASNLEIQAQLAVQDEQTSTMLVQATSGSELKILSTSHADYTNNVLVHQCPHDQVETADFRIRQLVRDLVRVYDYSGFETIPYDPKTMNSLTVGNTNCRIVVCNASVVRIPAHIYVNSVSKELSLSGALAAALCIAAGPELQSEMAQLNAELSNYGKSVRAFSSSNAGQHLASWPRQVGDIVCTRGYNLPCDYVLHAICPDGSNVTVNDFSSALVSIYKQLLSVACQLYPDFVEISIAIPLLSAGRLRGRRTLQECIAPLRDALKFAASQGVLSRFAKVYLVNSDKLTTESLLHDMQKTFHSDSSGSRLIAERLNPFDMVKFTRVYSTSTDTLYGCELRRSFAFIQLPPPCYVTDLSKLPATSSTNRYNAASSNVNYNNYSASASTAGGNHGTYASAVGTSNSAPLLSTPVQGNNSSISTQSTVLIHQSNNSSVASRLVCVFGTSDCVPFESLGISVVLKCKHFVCAKCYIHFVSSFSQKRCCKICQAYIVGLDEYFVNAVTVKPICDQVGNNRTSMIYRVDFEVANQVWILHFPKTEEGNRKALRLLDAFKANKRKVFIANSASSPYYFVSEEFC